MIIFLIDFNLIPLVYFKDGRCAKMDDILPDGYRVKKGDGVYYMAYAMGRLPYIWGEDAGEFRSKRWLKNGIFNLNHHSNL